MIADTTSMSATYIFDPTARTLGIAIERGISRRDFRDAYQRTGPDPRVGRVQLSANSG